MKAIFLSDAHLKERTQPGYGRLLDFLRSMNGAVDHLFVAGDFFDFWFCHENAIYEDFKPVLDALFELGSSGVRISYCEGNHDFFLKDFFEPRGVTVFSESADIRLDGSRIYLAHGDTVDRTNRRYLFLRRILRSRSLYALQRILPPALIWKVALFSSNISRDHLGALDHGLVEKMKSFAGEKFAEGYDAVILGHCHEALLERRFLNGTERTLALLGDWISQFTYLQYEAGTFTLMKYDR
ncbi:MAG: UDP-2,3-diacylglucosamine diphosphatase [Deltaproteobacteria bacterium]|nr:UDP-2,3-diacylglucosamine diphosphatase [Deltaproteobacteria bacterium]